MRSCPALAAPPLCSTAPNRHSLHVEPSPPLLLQGRLAGQERGSDRRRRDTQQYACLLASAVLMFGSCAALALPSSHALLRRWQLGPGPRNSLARSWAALKHRPSGQRAAALPVRLMGSLGAVPNGAEPHPRALGTDPSAGDNGAVKPDMFWGSATAAYQVTSRIKT